MAGSQPNVIMVELSPSFADSVRTLLGEAGFAVRPRSLDEDGALPPANACLVLAGGAEPDGLDWIDRHRSPAGPPMILVGAASDHRLAIGALARGARDYFALPGDLDVFRRALERLARDSNAAVAAEGFAKAEQEVVGFGALIGGSPSLQATVVQARRAAAIRDVTVLIGGETGTGKEVLARAIHYHSPRSKAPFVDINCAAIPVNLLESELFGHEKGAFTGAVGAKTGLFEMADGGTLFLDEIGHLPLDLQPKLLRSLEQREVRRVGGHGNRKVDVRVVAATHVDLAQAVRSGTFREDLYYRLNVVHLVLPPLRDRGDDVLELAAVFAARLALQHQIPVPELTDEVRQALQRHSWPGNIRELRNAIERALVLSPPGTIELGSLLLTRPRTAQSDAGPLPFPAPLGTIIRAAALETLARVDGNKSEAARRLGISRPRLQRILDGDTD